MSEITLNNCKNCNEVLTGRYCSKCGQDAHTERISYHTIIHEIEHGIIHIDKGIFFTIKELILKPGITIKNYLAGKRISHFKPFAFLFIMATIYAVVAKYSNSGTVFNDIDIKAEDDADMIISEAFEWIKDHYAYTIVFLLPFTALSTYIVFRKNDYNFFEHLVINAYTTGVKTFINILFLPLSFVFKSEKSVSNIENINFIIGVIITVYFFYEVFDLGTKKKRIFSSIFAYILNGIFIILLLFIAIFCFTDVLE